MKKFNVTVNGNTYEVEVEEVGAAASAQPRPTAAPAAQAPAAAPAAPAPKAAAPAPAQVSAGDTPIVAPMPGKVSKVMAKAGQQVKKGEVILILEAMKMQNEIGAPSDGTVKSVNVAAGQNVKPGEVMAVLG
ncbi:biotin/lipoyl-containing protein [Sporomusa sphaeroides]|uniref:Glutaconyl-CoA decarboxylase subunit gamma n=1 Tax=Sporomusa sphaeroides DSM 2875 TaxID=1337886 RepID=A0ABM9W5F9_9FIRM|nr:biotin/lipoyl-containing protein [Sporomusa sphaeroides]OLS57890.1 glutaconyl-CoA decarboxylase subunit gamma [Sporomusa sphaeroides DSM 2875]CVK20403.1 Glutaconyl-CoA decarboxylase subunit gamma [Sporomusa sphaeroides DSM 2875]